MQYTLNERLRKQEAFSIPYWDTTPLGFKYNVNFFILISASKLETPLRIYTPDIFIEISNDVVQPKILIPCV